MLVLGGVLLFAASLGRLAFIVMIPFAAFGLLVWLCRRHLGAAVPGEGGSDGGAEGSACADGGGDGCGD